MVGAERLVNVMQSNHGAARFMRVIHSHTESQIPSELWLELGNVVDVNGGLGLKVDNRDVTYPPGAWFVAETLTAPDPLETLTATGTDSYMGGTVTVTVHVTRPKILHPLQAGDRVLVALLHGGLDPVVIDRITGVGFVTQ